MTNEADPPIGLFAAPDGSTSKGTVAVTGASGFIGQRVLARLLRDGQPAMALSRRGVVLPGVRNEVVTDYGDISALARALEGVDSLIHLAARAHAADGGKGDADLFKEANVQTARSVARASVAAGVRRIVLVSSIGVNGHAFSGDDVPKPAEHYAVSKLEAERALALVVQGTPTDYVIVRPPLVYGPGCPGNFGRLVRLVARAPLVPLGALDEPRSFIYVENLVDALLLATRHAGVSRGTYVLSDGRDVTVGEVVRRLAAVLRPSQNVVRDVPPWLLAVVARIAGQSGAYSKLAAPLQLDARQFSRATGWHAPFDPVVGLEETARQFRERPKK